MPLLAGLFYWWPKMTGRLTSHRGGVVSFALILAGMHLTFFPMHISGLLGMPRRIYTYPRYTGWDAYNLLSTVGSFLLALGFLVTLFVFVQSLLHGPRAGDDPWGGNTLEWATGSPPKEYNFPVLPTVHSLNPLWDGETLASMEQHGEDDLRTLTHEHQTLRTSELDARIERVMTMPEETIQPLCVALSLTITVVFLLVGVYVGAYVGAALLFLSVLAWTWNRPEVES
jgi:cytochrome c oxidase subunit 1/cytochrome c oxidase subunit I+III